MFKKEDVEKFHMPRWEELPEIDLYLDQVVTFIDKYLLYYLNTESDEKDEKKEKNVLTKTMINNYVKQKIIEAPVKKKYNRNNMAYLFVICILKQCYSINDIGNLIKFTLETTPLELAYNRFCDVLENAIKCTCGGKLLELINKKPITASESELRINPPSRSAKLRIAKKLR